MKLTAKNYLALYEKLGEINVEMDHINRITGDYAKLPAFNKQQEAVIADIEKYEHVLVAYSIGSRGYFDRVAKIGKSYFDGIQKMTKSRGYWFVTEIPEITDEMRERYEADQHYY